MAKRLSESKLEELVLREYDAALAWSTAQRFNVYGQAWAAYWSQPTGDEQEQADADEGNEIKVNLQSADVADQIEAFCAQVGPSLGRETRVIFEPQNGEDMAQAQVESQIVAQQVFYTRHARSGWLDLMASLRDGGLLGLSIVKCWVDRREQTRRDEHELLTAEEADAVLAPTVALERVSLISMDTHEAMADGGEPFYDVVVERTITKQRLELMPIAPENFIYTDDAGVAGIGQCRAVGELTRMRREAVRDEADDKRDVDRLQAATQWRPEQLARRRFLQDAGYSGNREADEIDVCWLYVLAPSKTGKTQLTQYRALIAMSDRKVLKLEVASLRPYAVGTLIQAAHEVQGISLYERLADIQAAKTQLTRQLVDNGENNLYPGLGIVDGAANLGDAKKRGPRWVVRLERPDAIVPIPVQDMGPSIIGSMQYLDRVRTARAGAAIEMQGPELQIQGDTAHGLERQFGAREQMTALMLRTWAETLLSALYVLVHTTLREQWQGPLMVRVNEQWQPIDPSQWPDRDAVQVSIDQGQGSRAQMAQALGMVIQKQEQLFQQGAGGVLVGMPQAYNAFCDWGRQAGLPNIERYMLDPSAPAQMKAAQDKAAAAQQQAAAQGAIMQAIAEMQAGVEAWKAELENSFKYYNAALNAFIEEAKLVSAGGLQLEMAAMEGMRQHAEGQGRADSADPIQSGGLNAAGGAQIGQAGAALGGNGAAGQPTVKPLTLGMPGGGEGLQ